MVFLIIHEYSWSMFQNQNLQITFLVLHIFDPKDDFSNRQKFHKKISNFMFQWCSQEKNNFSLIWPFLLVIGYLIEIPQMITKKIWRWPRKDDFWSKMFKSTKMIKILCDQLRKIFRKFRGYVLFVNFSLILGAFWNIWGNFRTENSEVLGWSHFCRGFRSKIG